MTTIEMKPVHRGEIRAAGYSRSERILRIEFENRKVLDYVAVPEETAQRFLRSSSPQSLWRDTIEEEFTSRVPDRAPGAQASADARAALEALFGGK